MSSLAKSSRTTRFLCLVFVVGSLVGCQPAFETFNDPGGKYSVKMPGKPKPGSLGLPVPGATVYQSESSSYLATAAHVDLGQAARQANPLAGAFGGEVQIDAETVYSGMESGVRASPNIENVKVTSCSISGHSGREMTYNIKGGGTDPRTGKKLRGSTNMMRFVIIKNEMFVFEYGAAGSSTAAAKTMMDSIVLNVGGAPAATPAGSPAPGVTIAGSHDPMMPMGTPMTGTPQANGGAGYTPPADATTQPNPMQTALAPGVTINGTGANNANAGTNTGYTPPPMNTGATATELAPGVTINGAGGTATTPMPMGNAGYNPMGAAGTTPMNVPGVFPGLNPMGNNTVQPPDYTGTMLSEDSEIKRNDKLQAWANGRWVNVIVERVFPNGMVIVRTYGTPPFITAEVGRSFLQIPAEEIGTASTKSSKNKSTTKTSRTTPKVTRPAAVEPSQAPSDLDSMSPQELLAFASGKGDLAKRVKALELLAEDSTAKSDADISSGLVKLLSVSERTIRIGAARSLEKWGDEEAQSAMQKLLGDSTVELRHSAMQFLAAARLESAAADIAARLKVAADRKAAAAALTTLGEAAEPALVALLQDKDEKTRQAICEILKEVGTKESLTALQKGAKEWSGISRIAARQAAEAIEDRSK